MIKRLFLFFSGLVLGFMPQLSVAIEPGGGYEGIAGMYYAFIIIILAYGVKDIFGKKWMLISLLPMVAVAYYLLP